jgi:signal transduction histidine kinase
MARATVDEARRLIAGLRPTVLDDMGLVQAVQLLIRTLQVDGWQVTLNENLSGERLPAVIETALYRIAQEMLNNVRKHTTPCVVGVTLQRDDQIVLLRVHDAGCGFTPTAQPVNCEPGTHIGLTSMQERVGLLRGTWYLESAPNQGTLVEVRIPLAAPEPPKGVADHA